MAFVNFATREITAKIVYYGPGLGGKTTSLQYIHNSLSPENRGKIISLATEEDRTIYFDFLPLHLGKIQEFAVRVQLYTVPGQVRYNATRKLVLRGADGLVFVADSQRHKKLANIESFNNLEENLREHGKALRDIPHILQFNKIDLPSLLVPAELNQLLNKYNVPFFETCATSGIGVLDALKSITKLVFNDLGKKALLQKKAKVSAAVTPRTEGTFVRKLTTAPAPQREDYFRESQYSDQQVKPQQPERSFEERLLEANDPLVEHTQKEATPVDLQDRVKQVEPIPELEDVPYENSELTLSEDRLASADSFTYKALFDSTARFGMLMTQLEREISSSDAQKAVQTARDLYSHFLSDLIPKDYMLDGNESSVILAMGMNYKRFLRFKHLLRSEVLEASDLLFIHHYISDLYLSLKEF